MRSRWLPAVGVHGNAWNHPTTASPCPRCTDPENSNRNVLCTPPFVGKSVERPRRKPARTCMHPRPYLRPAKEERSLTQFVDTLTETKKQSHFGGRLHSSMCAWSTTSSNPTQKLSVFPCLCFEWPCQPAECNACWSMARQPPLDTPRASGGWMCHRHQFRQTVLFACVGQRCAAAPWGVARCLC